MDDPFRDFASVLSSDPVRSVAGGDQTEYPAGYPDVATMIAAEARRPDGIDAASIMTPNDSHHEYA